MAAVPLVGEEARDDVAIERLHVRAHGGQRVTVIGIAGQRLHMGYKMAAPGVADRGGDGDFNADLWTTPALQEESTKVAVCANLSGFDLRLSRLEPLWISAHFCPQ